LDQIWDRVSPRLLKAQTREDVIRSYEGADIGAYALQFVQLADLILQVLEERKFPKQSRKAQINFLADSIGGPGMITPRSSRDICEKSGQGSNVSTIFFVMNSGSNVLAGIRADL